MIFNRVVSSSRDMTSPLQSSVSNRPWEHGVAPLRRRLLSVDYRIRVADRNVVLALFEVSHRHWSQRQILLEHELILSQCENHGLAAIEGGKLPILLARNFHTHCQVPERFASQILKLAIPGRCSVVLVLPPTTPEKAHGGLAVTTPAGTHQGFGPVHDVGR